MVTIISDLGGVYFTDGTRLAAKKIAAKYGLEEERVYAVLDGELGTGYREANISLDEFWSLAKKELGITEDFAVLNELWLSCYEKVPEVVALLRKARKNHRLFFLSDNAQERVEYLEEKYSFLEDFDGGVFSHDVGFRKPDPRIYLAVLEKAQAKPEDCVYIDNKKELLPAAEALGMRTIHFRNPEQLEEELRSLDE